MMAMIMIITVKVTWKIKLMIMKIIDDDNDDNNNSK